jgi:DNA-binding transcriptional LysR family regulator
MLPHFEEIICFAAVCKAGSITQAALLLKCSKANVSRKITALEKRIETKLLQRSTRSIYLTEAGSRFKAQAMHIYDEVRQFDNRTRDEEHKLVGNFRITAPVSLSTFIIAPLLFELQKAFPNIRFELIPTNENMKLIESEVDLAIRTGSVVDDTLVAKRLGEFHEGFFTSSQNLPEFAGFNLDDLSTQNLILNQDKQLNLFDGSKVFSMVFDNYMQVREFQIATNLLVGSQSIAWLPSYCEGVKIGGETITRLLPSIGGQPWSVYLVFPFQTPLPLKLKSIISHIETHFSGLF